MKTSIKTPKSFPISFTLGGHLSNPSIEGVAAAGLLTAAAVAYGLSKVAPKEVQDLLKAGGKTIERSKKAVKAKVRQKLNDVKKQGEDFKRETTPRPKAGEPRLDVA